MQVLTINIYLFIQHDKKCWKISDVYPFNVDNGYRINRTNMFVTSSERSNEIRKKKFQSVRASKNQNQR